jgi:hypothetical protein
VDSAVLDLTERLCHRFQILTGRTNVWLAFQLTNLSIVIYFVWVTILYWLSADLALRTFVAFFCGGLFVLLTRTIFKTSIETAEQEAYRRTARGLRNPRRLRDAPLRTSFLTISALLPFPFWLGYIVAHSYATSAATVASIAPHMRFVVLAEVLMVLTTVVLYLLACDPLPPCEGRVKVWMRGLIPARSTAVPETDARS